MANTQPTGFVSDDTDCDDTNANIYPGATETPDNGIDEDCDGFDLLTWYEDADNDNFGNASVSQTANTQPAGFVPDDTDCDDTDANIFPGQGCGGCSAADRVWILANQAELDGLAGQGWQALVTGLAG